jgi:hypothetical protein
VATRTDFDLQVAGLKELIVGLRELQGPELGKVIDRSLTTTMRRVVVPEMKRQMAADFKRPGSHRPKEGLKVKRGQSGPTARNVTVRSVRKRSGELVAKSAGPRSWYSHFPIGGTRAHVITAAGLDARSVRQLNRGTASRALRIAGAFAARVEHPGSRGTNSIAKAVQAVVPRLNARYRSDLEAAYQKHLVQPTRRAKPR